MKKRFVLLTGLFLMSAFLPVQAQERPQSPPSFEKMDENGDGVLSKDEVKGPLARDFDRFDEDGSGTLTESELPPPPQKRQ